MYARVFTSNVYQVEYRAKGQSSVHRIGMLSFAEVGRFAGGKQSSVIVFSPSCSANANLLPVIIEGEFLSYIFSAFA